MSKRIIPRPKASQDLDDHFAYIAEDNLETALQFFDSVRLTVAQLAGMPSIDSLYPVENSCLQGLRKWQSRILESTYFSIAIATMQWNLCEFCTLSETSTAF